MYIQKYIHLYNVNFYTNLIKSNLIFYLQFMLENLGNAILIAIVYSIILTFVGIGTKIMFNVDIGRLINVIIIIVGGLGISYYAFTNTDAPLIESINVLVNWFLYMILFVIIPMAFSEPISSIFYSHYYRD